MKLEIAVQRKDGLILGMKGVELHAEGGVLTPVENPIFVPILAAGCVFKITGRIRELDLGMQFNTELVSGDLELVYGQLVTLRWEHVLRVQTV